jgi:hypothetical protein
MRINRLTAVFFVTATAACGPSESLPPDHDAGTNNDAGDAGATCPGVCAPGLPLGWRGPALVWIGAKADAPLCSAVAGAPGEFYTGYADPAGPPCGACKCEAATGSCELPATLTASAATCSDDGSGAAHTSFDPPASWGGTCTTANAIPAGKLCGGVPCVQSVTIAPLTLKQSGCLPIEPTKGPPTTWKTFVRACSADTNAPTCGTKAGVCAPVSPGPEYKTCTLKQGDPTNLDCPDTYPDRRVFYDDPTPYCSPCTCGAPMGSSCAGSIDFFQNDVCSGAPSTSVSVHATGPTCADVALGAALASKAAGPLSYYAGSCEPSGGATAGTVICCLP